MRHRLPLAVAVGLATSASAFPARSEAAAPAPAEVRTPTAARGQVVVLRPADIDEVTRTALARVTGELTAARFLVTVFPLDPRQDPTTQVETVAPELQPIAAFAIAHSMASDSGTISIWVCDRLGRRTTIQRMPTASNDISRDAEVLALEAIELIRVSIAGLWPAHARDASRDPSESASARFGTTGSAEAPAPTTELSLGMGIAGLQDGATVATEWMGALMATLKLRRGLAIRARVRGLGPGVTLAALGGRATVHRQAGTLSLGWVFWPAERVRALLSIGGGVEHMAAVGSAADGARARSEDAWSALASAGIAASARLSNVFAIGVEVDAILALPRTTLQIDTLQSQPFSRPGIVVTTDLQARF